MLSKPLLKVEVQPGNTGSVSIYVFREREGGREGIGVAVALVPASFHPIWTYFSPFC